MAPTPDEIAQAAAEATQQPPAPDPSPAAIAAEPEAPVTPTITHNEPILASGSAGPVVRKLVNLLAVAGHTNNTIVNGENPGGVLDQSVMADVKAFAKEHDIEESPNLEISGDFVGPYTWQALYDAAERALQL